MTQDQADAQQRANQSVDEKYREIPGHCSHFNRQVKRGEFVYDPFLGSGTTPIAAESTERVRYGMEIDPRLFRR